MPSSRPPVRARGKKKPGDTKTRILDAADAIFVRQGIDGARMQQIADAAGVKKPLLHYYFKSKADLARSVWLRIAVTFGPQIMQMLASDLSLDKKIDRYVESYYTMLTRHPYLLAYIVSEGARRPEFVDAFYSAERRRAARLTFSKLREQVEDQIKSKKMAPISVEQFFVTLASNVLFPFAARPMLMEGLGLHAKEFTALMGQRQKELPAFLKKAFRR
jgi:TetR/AcrR family transcriptional regulator